MPRNGEPLGVDTAAAPISSSRAGVTSVRQRTERIHVDTDTDGVVWLFGSANTQEAADKAASIARGTVGETRVHRDIKVILND